VGLCGRAIAISILGFNQMGWTTSGTADRMATERANAAVVAAFVPFCVAKAQQDADGQSSLSSERKPHLIAATKS